MKITVVGLGKIGLPLAVQFATKGYQVVGTDLNADTVHLVNQGTAPFPGEPLLSTLLPNVVREGLFTATTNTTEAVTHCDVVVVAVPLLINDLGEPDFSAIDSAATAIGRGLKRGTLVCFETTLPVGTTRHRLGPLLERESGLSVSQDWFLAFSPERVFTGRVFEDLRRYPKLIGGVDMTSASLAQDFYQAVLDFDPRPDLQRTNGVWDLGSSEAAEFAKLAETTYRDVNIGLANQFARFAEGSGIDVYSVIEACNSQPFSSIHQPGISVGGHCIPVYPHLYLWKDPDATIVRAAREVNSEMPENVVRRLESAVGDLTGKTVSVLGASYRPGVKETAFSGVFALAMSIETRGGLCRVHDPLYADDEIQALNLIPFHRGESAEAAIIHTAHPEYLSWRQQDIRRVRHLVDGRNFLNKHHWPDVDFIRLGAAYNKEHNNPPARVEDPSGTKEETSSS